MNCAAASSHGRLIRSTPTLDEYIIGGEHVEVPHFTEAEWEVMLTDPRFGYVQECGHSTLLQWSDGTCGACEAMMEVSYTEDELAALAAERDALAVSAPSAPAADLALDGEIPF